MLRTLALAASLAVAPGVAAVADEAGGPPPNGWFGSFGIAAIVCDTKDEIAEIVAGSQEKGGIAKAFAKLNGEIGPNGDEKCVHITVHNIAVGESIALGKALDAAGDEVNTWAVHIGNARNDSWLLYAERVDADKRQTDI